MRCSFILTILTLPLVLTALDFDEDIALELNITNHTIELEVGPLQYTAMTGKCPIFNKTQEKTADLFFIAYLKDDEEDRPITFIFPGGPGGAATNEAICSIGPRRLLTSGEGRSVLPPFKIIDNQETLLEYTDLIFIDPVDCGFSKATEDANLNYFYSTEGDLQTLGECIHTCIDTLERWNSPIYLAGCSYGSFRAAGLASNLLQYNVAVKGIILTGCLVDYSPYHPQRNHFLPDCLRIPTYAATAWYHGRLWPEKSLEEVIEYSRAFAFNIYAPVMLKPSRINALEKEQFEQILAHVIGLPVDTVRRYNSRISEDIYTSEFFGPERKVLGGLDTRAFSDISTIDPASALDPSYFDNLGLIPAFKTYLQKELNTRYPHTQYISLNNHINRWDFYTKDSDQMPDMFQRVRRLLTINPLLKVFIGSGYYDCRTAFAATEYCFDHLELPPSYKDNLQFEYYEAGHGIMLDYPSLKKWKKDLTKFYGH